jgi:hypothetical protein
LLETTVKLLSVLALALVFGVTAGAANAQVLPPQGAAAPPTATSPGSTPTASMPMDHMHHMAGMHGAVSLPYATPTEPGQAAFGAIQEIVRMLQADPTTNWARVDIDALRQHLIDMDEVTLRASAEKEPVEYGLRIVVTGGGRTLEAIQRMLPEHAASINGLYGWSVQANALPNGEVLTVTGHSAADQQEIRGLGFMGIMVLGTHQMHHLAMAKGEMMHMH